MTTHDIITIYSSGTTVNGIYYPDNELKSVDILKTLMPSIVAAAQKEYDSWELDENGYDAEVGEGGICHLIADEICSVLGNNGIDCSTVSAQIGEQHVWVVAKFEEGVYNIDIHPSYYETGGGYNWEKIPDVVFSEDMVEVDMISSDPEEFDQFIDG